jgi:HKD family nuclease
MRIDVIDNDGSTMMVAELRKELENCTSARLATASLTRGGIKFIENTLNTGRKSLHIKLLIGLYNGHTESAALRRLLRIQKHFGEKLEIRISRNKRFHWKTYLFARRSRVTAFVGSSNLTNDGLGKGGEFNIRMTSTSMNGVMAHITETFERAWKRDSAPLDRRIVEVFSPASRRSKDAELLIDPIIRGILRTPRTETSKKESLKETSILTSVEGFADRATIKAVKDKTTWYRRGWQWLVFSRRADWDRLRNAGAFYLAEQHSKGLLLSLNDVRDEDDFKTEDGQYLIAYQKRKGSLSRRVGPSLLTQLKQAGVVKKKEDLRRDQRFSCSHREVIDSLLRVPHA